MRRKVTIAAAVLLLVSMCFAFSACGKKHEEPSRDADAIISEDRVSRVKAAVLDPSFNLGGADSTPEPTDLIEMLLNDRYFDNIDDSARVDNPVITRVVESAVFKDAEFQSDNTVKLTITAPDMMKIFNSLLDKGFTEPLSSEFLEEYMMKAIEDASNIKEFIVTVPTIEVNGELLPDPADEGLRNALTGGLKDAYEDFCIKYFKALFDSAENND